MVLKSVDDFSRKGTFCAKKGLMDSGNDSVAPFHVMEDGKHVTIIR